MVFEFSSSYYFNNIIVVVINIIIIVIIGITLSVYSVGPPEVVDPLIYDGFVEELVEVLEIKGTDIMVSGGVYMVMAGRVSSAQCGVVQYVCT